MGRLTLEVWGNGKTKVLIAYYALITYLRTPYSIMDRLFGRCFISIMCLFFFNMTTQYKLLFIS